MIKPGFFIVIQPVTLQGPLGLKVKLQRKDWIVTNGVVVGVFEKFVEMDWLPLQWGPGRMVLLDDFLSVQLEKTTASIPFARLEHSFQSTLLIDEDDMLPGMARPKITEGLGSYLHVRRR